MFDLQFLNQNEFFPPSAEKSRLERYWNNKQLFEAEHPKVYHEQFKRIERVVGNFQEVISYGIVTNFQKLLSLKMADLLLGEIPIINDGVDQEMAQLVAHSNLFNVAYEIALDISRFGTGIFYVSQDGDGKGIISATQPSCWFPVVCPDNVKKVKQHVLAWRYSLDKDGQEQCFLKVQIHEPGKVTYRTMALDNGRIGKLLEDSGPIDTGFDGFAVIPVHNTLTSERIYGIDDYMDIDSLVSEIEVRLAQISRILDKHTNPTMTGPFSALDFDEKTGQYYLKAGNYIPMDQEDGTVRYVTWDAQLDANFKFIEQLINLLYTLSETGGTLLGDATKTGAALSGTALRLRMMSPLSKVSRIRIGFDAGLKKAISLASQAGWKYYAPTDINIKWRDGLPDDELEMANIASIRTGGKPTLSQKRAIVSLDNVSCTDAEDILREIKTESVY